MFLVNFALKNSTRLSGTHLTPCEDHHYLGLRHWSAIHVKTAVSTEAHSSQTSHFAQIAVIFAHTSERRAQ